MVPIFFVAALLTRFVSSPLSSLDYSTPTQREAQRVLVELQERMAKRDSEIHGLELVYESMVTLAPTSTACPDQEFGIEYHAPDLEVLLNVMGCADKQPCRNDVSWDGSTCTWIRTVVPWDNVLARKPSIDEPATLAVLDAQRSAFPLLRLSVPSRLGLYWGVRTWAQQLSYISKPTLGQRKPWLGRDCMELIVDIESDREGPMRSPCRLLIDDTDTLLVAKMELFDSGSDLSPQLRSAQLKDGTALVINDEIWYRHCYIDVQHCDRLGDGGIWIGTSGKCGLDAYPGVFTETRVHLAESSISSDLPWRYGSLQIPDGTPVIHKSDGRQTFQGHEQDPYYYGVSFFAEHLALFNASLASQWRALEDDSDPLALWKDTGRTLYGFLLASDDHSLGELELRRQCSQWNAALGYHTVSEIQDFLRAQGFGIQTYRVGRDALPRNQPLLVVPGAKFGLGVLKLAQLSDDDTITLSKPGMNGDREALSSWMNDLRGEVFALTAVRSPTSTASAMSGESSYVAGAAILAIVVIAGVFMLGVRHRRSGLAA